MSQPSDIKLEIMSLTAFQQHTTIFLHVPTKRAVIFDPAGEVNKIVAAVGRYKIMVEKILITHGHLDHAGGAKELRRILSERQGHLVPVLGPAKEDEFLLANIEKYAAHFGIHDMQSVTVDGYFAGGETICFFEYAIQVFHTPGHTPGHVVYFVPAANFAVVGDTLFYETVGRTDLEYGDSNVLKQSIRSVMLQWPDDTTVIPGHGRLTTIGHERLNNPFLKPILA